MQNKTEMRKQRHAERQLRKDLYMSVLTLLSVGIGLYDLSRPRRMALPYSFLK